MAPNPAKKLYNAIRTDNQATIRRLVDQGIDVNQGWQKAADDSICAPLSIAAILSRAEAARILIDAGADIEALDLPPQKPKPDFNYRLRNPLSYAAQAGCPDIVELLLENGARPEPVNDENPLRDAIIYSEGKKHLRVIEVLIAAGIKPTREPGRNGTSYLGFAVRTDPKFYTRGIVETLARCGADLNAACRNQKCLPLHEAITKNNDKGVAELLVAGADPSMAAPRSKSKEWSGLTPLEYAVHKKAKKNIITLLEDAVGTAESGAPAATKRKKSKGVNRSTAKKPSSKPTKQLTNAKAWDAIESALAAKNPVLFKSLVKGATAAKAGKLVGRTSIRLTSEIKEFFQRHNGQTGGEGLIVEPGSGESFLLLSVDDAAREWDIWQDLHQSGEFEDAEEVNSDPLVRNCWWHEKWLPFATNTAGDFLCFDNSPAKGGKVGQVITLWHDNPTREITFPNVRDMLNQIAEYYTA